MMCPFHCWHSTNPIIEQSECRSEITMVEEPHRCLVTGIGTFSGVFFCMLLSNLTELPANYGTEELHLTLRYSLSMRVVRLQLLI